MSAAQTLTPLNIRTGNPKVPVPVVIGAVVAFVAAAFVVAAIFWILWVAVHDYPNASSLLNLAELHKPQWVLDLDVRNPPVWAGWRILMVLISAAIAVVITAALTITGFYAYAGCRWTRWAGFAAVLLSGLSYLLIPLAWVSTLGAVILAVLLWLPTSGRFFLTWQLRRHPILVKDESLMSISYGPAPRYRHE